MVNAGVVGLVLSVLVLCSVLSVSAYLASMSSEQKRTKDEMPSREWIWGYLDTSTKFTFPHASTGWPIPIRTDKLGSGSAISVEEIVFDNELTVGQIKSNTVEVRIVGFKSDGTSHESKNIDIIPLATLDVIKVSVGEEVQKCVVVKKSYDVGGDAGFSDCVAYTVGVRLTEKGPGGSRPELNVHFRYAKK